MMEAVDVPPEGYSLIKAVYQRRLRLTRLLIDGGAYVNESNSRGETPLMIACMTKHMDLQSASKAKMVKYLLDNKADPNIQDKSGKTALMHACLEKAGPEVVSLLLMSGADPSLPDHSNCSALVYAINAADRDTLELLLKACKARGKEVIIITTDKSTSGRQKTKQYLNMPPPDLEECTSPADCACPSEIESNEGPEDPFSFKELYGEQRVDNSSERVPLMTKSSSTPARFKLTQVLQCDPWLKCCPAVFQQRKIASSQELQVISPVEELSRLCYQVQEESWRRCLLFLQEAEIRLLLSAPREVVHMEFGNLKHLTVMLDTKMPLFRLYICRNPRDISVQWGGWQQMHTGRVS